MTVLASVLAAALAVTFSVAAWVVSRSAARIGRQLQQLNEGSAKPVELSALEELGLERRFDREMDELRRIVHDSLDKMERLRHEISKLDGRARYSVRSHLAKLEEIGIDPSDLVLSAAQELRVVDGGGGGGEGVPPVHQDVESPPPADADWRTQAMTHKYGG